MDPLMVDLFFDPQTSGGLLISIAEAHAARLLDSLINKGVTESRIIGEVVAGPGEKIFITQS